jgi:hypothetical protein
MREIFKAAIIAALVLIVCPAVAQATVVSSLPSGTSLPLPVVNYFGPGPQTIAPGINLVVYKVPPQPQSQVANLHA